ncbi:hypothetical protein [Microcoleus sp. FACHB-831]|nr:hypothetical protein [Microcoleus sp. FACHB-831]
MSKDKPGSVYTVFKPYVLRLDMNVKEVMSYSASTIGYYIPKSQHS